MSDPFKGFKVGHTLKKTNTSNCYKCPIEECEKTTIAFENNKKINKTTGVSSSSHLYTKKAMLINTLGGPGELWSSKCKGDGGNKFRGVDKKHNSYDRYLARKVGGVLRNARHTTEQRFTPCSLSVRSVR